MRPLYRTPKVRVRVQRFILTVEGPNLHDSEEIELPRLPSEGDPIETRFGTCIVTSTEVLPENGSYDGAIACRMP
jgi:hypothetical protein